MYSDRLSHVNLRHFQALTFSVFLALGVHLEGAVTFTITSLEGTELTFDDASAAYGAPTTLNSLVKFTADGTTYSTESFYALEPSGMTNEKSLQYQGVASPLYPDRESYLTAGNNGLSMSTGANLTTADPAEAWTFTRIFLDPAGVGDGIPDFLSVDIAQNQSGDVFDLIDSAGTVLATLGVNSSDWNKVGEQDLARVDNDSGVVSNATFDGRFIYGLAIELSDFVVVSTGEQLAATDTAILAAISNLRIRVPGQGNKPRTDYAFVASNTDTIRFQEQVPEPDSLALLTLPALLGLARRKRAGRESCS